MSFLSPSIPLLRKPYAGTGSATPVGGVNCFVTKISSDGVGLGYSTVIGGNGSDVGWDVAVDGAHYAYVVGVTSSNIFPNTKAPLSMQQATNFPATNAPLSMQ